MLRIIGIIIDGSHGAELVEALYEHSFMVHVGEPERSDDPVHSLFLAPFFNSVEQCARHLYLIGEIDEAEAHVAGTGLLVDQIVDDACDAAHRPAVFVSDKATRLAEIERWVFFGFRVSMSSVINGGT